jgi:hypothetical protein
MLKLLFHQAFLVAAQNCPYSAQTAEQLSILLLHHFHHHRSTIRPLRVGLAVLDLRVYACRRLAMLIFDIAPSLIFQLFIVDLH